MAGPKMTDKELAKQAGFDKKYAYGIELKSNMKKFFRHVDEHTAVNRYVWHNIPFDLTSQDIERLLYYRGQLCAFYIKSLNKFYLLPYALDGTIDVYGRYNTIHPVPFASGVDEENTENKDVNKKTVVVADILSKLHLKVAYGVITEELKPGDIENYAVILRDYTNQISQTCIPRRELNDALLDVMSDCIPFMRTALLAATGVKGTRVDDANQASAVKDASSQLKGAALAGDPLTPITVPVEIQELMSNPTGKASEYMLALQSLDNLRLGAYGIENGGLFEKKAHELEREAAINGGPIRLLAQDGLAWRQNFCHIFNSIFNIGMSVELNESESLVDEDLDGVLFENNEDGSETGIETGGPTNEADV